MSLACLGVAAALGLQRGAAPHETGRRARESLVFSLLVPGKAGAACKATKWKVTFKVVLGVFNPAADILSSKLISLRLPLMPRYGDLPAHSCSRVFTSYGTCVL